MYKATGTIAFKDPVTKLTETFTKQVFGIDVEGSSFTKQFYLECLNEKIDALTDLEVGQRVSVSFNPTCNTGTSRDGKKIRFVSLRLIAIEKLQTVTLEDLLQEDETEEPASPLQSGNPINLKTK